MMCRNVLRYNEDNVSRMLKCTCQLGRCVFMNERERKPCREEVRPRCIFLQLAALLIDTCAKWHHEPKKAEAGGSHIPTNPVFKPSFFF